MISSTVEAFSSLSSATAAARMIIVLVTIRGMTCVDLGGLAALEV